MDDVSPQGANVRKAVQWISDKRQYEPDKSGPLVTLIEKAAQRFDLSPKDQEFIFRFFSNKE